jgi:hypothetical protein
MHELGHEHDEQGFIASGTPRGRMAVAEPLEQVAYPMPLRKLRISEAEWAYDSSERTVTDGVGLRQMFAEPTLPDAITLKKEVWTQPWELVLQRPIASPDLGSQAIGDGFAQARLSQAGFIAFSLAMHTLSTATGFLARDAKGLYEPHPKNVTSGGMGTGFT